MALTSRAASKVALAAAVQRIKELEERLKDLDGKTATVINFEEPEEFLLAEDDGEYVGPAGPEPLTQESSDAGNPAMELVDGHPPNEE